MSPKTSSLSSSKRPLQWIIRGNLVIPTTNPFRPSNDAAAAADDDDDDDVLWLGPGLKILLNHVLTVDSLGIIQTIEPARVYDARVSNNNDNDDDDATDKATILTLSKYEFLCPGLIDLHIHAPQYSYSGTATDRPLMGDDGWLETYTFPSERRLRDNPELTNQVYRKVVKTTLRHGTTTAVYFATLDLQPCRQLVDICHQQGQRALVGKVCMDRNAPLDYQQSTQQNLQETKSLLEYIQQQTQRNAKTRPSPLVLPLITPRFIPTCTPALLQGLGQLAKEHNCHITSHLSESYDEVAFTRHLDQTTDWNTWHTLQQSLSSSSSSSNTCPTYVPRTDAEIFDTYDLLSDRCIMAHSVHLTNNDWTLLRKRGTGIAHCPLSNFCFAGQSFQARWALTQNNKVGLGTDIAGGYHPSMWHSSRMAVVASQALQHQRLTQTKPLENSSEEKSPKENDPIIDYRHAFYMATLGGAVALGMDDKIGTLRVGMEFDALVVSTEHRVSTKDSTATSSQYQPIDIFEGLDSLSDVFQKLCVLGDDRNIKRVFVQGRDVTVR